MNVEKITNTAHIISNRRKIRNISKFSIHYEFVMIYSWRQNQENGMILTCSLQRLPASTYTYAYNYSILFSNILYNGHISKSNIYCVVIPCICTGNFFDTNSPWLPVVPRSFYSHITTTIIPCYQSRYSSLRRKINIFISFSLPHLIQGRDINPFQRSYRNL